MTDPRPRAASIEQFCRTIAPPLELVGAGYSHGPMNGHEWRWSTDAGAWAVTVGGALEGGPRVTGPGVDNRWHMLEATLEHADLVILMLQLAGALPGRPTAMGLAARAPRQVTGPARPRLGMAAPGMAPVDMPPAGSDLPSRSGEWPATRRPAPYPTDPGRGPGAAYTPQPTGETRSAAEEDSGLMGRIYGSKTAPPRVLGGGGPAEYGSDGVAYEGDRIMPVDPYKWRPSGAVRQYLEKGTHPTGDEA